MSRIAHSFGGVCLTVTLGLSMAMADTDRPARSHDHQLSGLPGRIELLIQQLGAREYGRRQGAASELR